ncbi:MAG: hypothetical protein AAF633_25645, partial [Chloroflexota bacterium]
MTVVFEREIDGDGPVLHALIIGCGHFPHLPDAPIHDRLACPDSARAVVEFLVRQRDNLFVPLASITCLITEANGDPGVVPITNPDFDSRLDSDTQVSRADR